MHILPQEKNFKILLSLFYNKVASTSLNYDNKYLKMSSIFRIRVKVEQKYLKYRFENFLKFCLRYMQFKL
jgi:hypothetical protein